MNFNWHLTLPTLTQPTVFSKEWEMDIGCLLSSASVTWVVTNEELLVTYRISVGVGPGF